MKLLQDIAFFECEGRPYKKLFLTVQIETALQKFHRYAMVYHLFFFYSDVELNNVVMVEKEDVLFRYGVLLPFRYLAGYCCTFKSGFQFTGF